MGIKDLDGRYRPQRLGKVRLGRTREQKIKGKVIEIPYATEFFVLDTMPEEIREEYGEEPTTLRIEFLFNSIEQVFPHFHKFYLRRGLRCLGDGEIVLYRVGGTAEKPIVYIRNAAIATDVPKPCWEEWATEYGTTDPMGNSLRCLGFDCPSSEPRKCRPTGRLCFAIQGHEALGYYEMGTRSINAIAGIVGQLELCMAMFGHITAMPWELHLSPETVQVNGKGMKIYVPWIRIEPTWMQRHFPIRGRHLRLAEGQKRADIADLYGDEDVDELDHEPTSQVLLEAARKEEQEEITPESAQRTVGKARTVIDEQLEEMDAGLAKTPEEAQAFQEAIAPPEGLEVITKEGNLLERLMIDANHNLEKRGYDARYQDAFEVQQALGAGGISGMLDSNKYLDYLTIALDAKETNA